MASQRSTVKNLYKSLLFMGRDYPLGYEFFRSRCHQAFLKNSTETDPVKIKKMIAHGRFVMRELEALYKLKKYRTLKKRYYEDNDEEIKEIIKKLNQHSS